jgi:hypothetical protein
LQLFRGFWTGRWAGMKAGLDGSEDSKESVCVFFSNPINSMI